MAHALARARGAAAFFQGSLTIRASLQDCRTAALSGQVPFCGRSFTCIKASELPVSFQRWHSQAASSSQPQIQSVVGSEAQVLALGFSSVRAAEGSVSARATLSRESVLSSFDGASLTATDDHTAKSGILNDHFGEGPHSPPPKDRPFGTSIDNKSSSSNGLLTLVVVGGGAAGIFGAIRAKELCPDLEVVVLEKSAPLSKVRISGGGRCNVTTGLHVEAGVRSCSCPWYAWPRTPFKSNRRRIPFQSSTYKELTNQPQVLLADRQHWLSLPRFAWGLSQRRSKWYVCRLYMPFNDPVIR